MTQRRSPALELLTYSVALFAAGCVDNKLHDRASGGGTDDLPSISVSPDALVFPTLDPGAEATDHVTVTNVGGAELHVSGWHIEGSAAFELAHHDRPTGLEPGESFAIDVAFSPLQAEEHATLVVESDDLYNPAALASLDGTGAYPELLISPDPYAFGDVMVGCALDVDLELLNVGLAPLTVDSAVPVGEGFTLTVGTPLTLEPGQAAPVVGTYTPTSTGTSEAVVYVTSNDPRGLVSTDWSGKGTSTNEVEDEFRQGTGTFDAVDLFVYVDQSGSMDDDQANLGANAALVTDALDAASLDWQLMVVNDDDGCADTGILTPASTDLEGTFAEAVTLGGGMWTEAGLTVAVNGLTVSGDIGCNAGFLREGARTVLMLVSDEPEQSMQSWDRRLDDILALAPTSAVVAVVGDTPRGCATAEPGLGYSEAAVASGGETLSICSADWGEYADTLAALGGSDKQSTFVLSSVPAPETIVVEVEGVVDTGWTFNSDANAVVWPTTNLPDAGVSIVVTYRLAGDCEQ